MGRDDVVICTSHSHRVLRPNIVLNFALDDGTSHTIECSAEKFHELRFNVALVFREMQTLWNQFQRQMTDVEKKKLQSFVTTFQNRKVNALRSALLGGKGAKVNGK